MIRTSTALNKSYWTDPAPRIKEFEDALEMKFGSKYIKILSGGSAHSFIVNTDKDAKFKKGDILMAASWSSPARNKPRGNIFDGTYRVRWTGAL
jgi:dTDP-4-amino-4,6-dideoxygalactose transaminase